MFELNGNIIKTFLVQFLNRIVLLCPLPQKIMEVKKITLIKYKSK